jgi:hypothetical protein
MGISGLLEDGFSFAQEGSDTWGTVPAPGHEQGICVKRHRDRVGLRIGTEEGG